MYQAVLGLMPAFEIILVYSTLNPLTLIKIPSSDECINAQAAVIRAMQLLSFTHQAGEGGIG